MESYTIDTPEFSTNITISETTDTNHADNINIAPKQLLQNTLVNRDNIEALQQAVQEVYQNANEFTLAKIAELINGAPATADTLKEIADLIADNKLVVDALDAAIGKKANQSELDTHVNNSTIHFTSSERTKLAGVAAGANKYTHPASAAGAKASGLYKIATDSSGHVTGAAAITKADITGLGIPGANTTYSTGTTSVAGLTKLYTSTGTSTDGTMTRAAITNVLKNLITVTRLTCNKITLLGHYDGESRTVIQGTSASIPIAVIPINTGFTDICWIQCEISGQYVVVRVKNTVDGSRETCPVVGIIWLKNL